MASTKKDPEVQMTHSDPGEELVEILLFKDAGKYKDDVFVAVNGETCQIKRGVPVKIKRKFAEVIQHSMQQDAATAQLIERESGRFRQEARVFE